MKDFFGKLTEEYLQVIKYLNENTNYVAIKFPHKYSVEINDLDILLNKKDWDKTIEYLIKKGYKLVRTENFEKNFVCLKKYISNKGIVSIDLFKEFLGNRIVMDSKEILKKRLFNEKNKIFIPNEESELLITKLHSKLRKRKYKEWEEKYIAFLEEKDIKVDKEKVNFFKVNKFSFNWIKRVFNINKKGITVGFVGVDGVGKSTLILELEKMLNKTSDLDVEKVYFGWKPFLWTTKLLDKLNKKECKNTKEKIKEKELKEKQAEINNGLKIIKNIVYINYFLEYFFKYIFFVYTKLRRSKSVFLDRYICDLFVQDKFSYKSKLAKKLMIKVFFKIDFLFFIYANPEEIYKRKQEVTLEKIKYQENKYQEIIKEFNGKLINNEKTSKETAYEILDIIWDELIEKMVW